MSIQSCAWDAGKELPPGAGLAENSPGFVGFGLEVQFQLFSHQTVSPRATPTFKSLQVTRKCWNEAGLGPSEIPAPSSPSLGIPTNQGG